MEGNENERNKWTDNRIGDSGASKISESLKVNTTLTELDLRGDDKEKNEKEKEMKMKWTNEQVTKWEMKEQTRLVNHWRLILHWLNWIWDMMNKSINGKEKELKMKWTNEQGTILEQKDQTR